MSPYIFSLEQHGKNFTPEDRRALFENVKEIMTYFLLFINCCEMVVSTDFNTEVNELARSMKDVVDTASGKMQFIFDDVSRICITSAIRVCALDWDQRLTLTSCVSWPCGRVSKYRMFLGRKV